MTTATTTRPTTTAKQATTPPAAKTGPLPCKALPRALTPLIDAAKQRLAKGQRLTHEQCEALRVKRYFVFRKCRFNRSANRLYAALRKLQAELEEFTETSRSITIREDWFNAGLPPVLEDSDSPHDKDGRAYLRDAEIVRSELAGFLWSVGAILSVLNSHVMEDDRRGRASIVGG